MHEWQDMLVDAMKRLGEAQAKVASAISHGGEVCNDDDHAPLLRGAMADLELAAQMIANVDIHDKPD